LKDTQFAAVSSPNVRKEIEYWHVEVHVQVRFKNLLHFSRARQGFGQTSYNENIATNAHHPAVEVSFTDRAATGLARLLGE